jgi:hypothetical protein
MTLPNMLDDELLSAYMHGFYGYGNLAARYWFIGREEGGGADCDEVAKRIETWRDRGEKELEDLRPFHEAAGIDDSFQPGANPQPTWKGPIISVLTATGRSIDKASIVAYQQSELGSADGETCLLEKLPLPKRKASDWQYGEWSSLAYLRKLSSYQRTLEKTRVPHILRLIERHQPRFVVFYGERQDWAGRLALPSIKESAFQTGRMGESNLILTDHSVARTNDGPERFRMIGEHMRALERR